MHTLHLRNEIYSNILLKVYCLYLEFREMCDDVKYLMDAVTDAYQEHTHTHTHTHTPRSSSKQYSHYTGK